MHLYVHFIINDFYGRIMSMCMYEYDGELMHSCSNPINRLYYVVLQFEHWIREYALKIKAKMRWFFRKYFCGAVQKLKNKGRNWVREMKKFTIIVGAWWLNLNFFFEYAKLLLHYWIEINASNSNIKQTSITFRSCCWWIERESGKIMILINLKNWWF